MITVSKHEPKVKKTTRLSPSVRATKQLLGKFFLSYHPDGAVLWQGRILSQPKPGLFLVQLYEWFLGEPSDQILVPIAQMQGWSFYPDVEGWHYATRLKTGAVPLLDPHVSVPSKSKEQPK